jgi:hypothetical protein
MAIRQLLGLLGRLPSALSFRSVERRHRRFLREAIAFPLASVPEGAFARLIGVARPFEQKVLEAPLSGRLCVYYDVSVDAMSAKGGRLRVLASEQEAVTFVLEDDGHRAIVDAAHAHISVAIDHVTESSLDMQSDRQAALLKQLNLYNRRVPLADGLRFREAILEVDERIAVFGCGVREADPQAPPGPGYREYGQTRLRLTGTERYPLLIRDDPESLR